MRYGPGKFEACGNYSHVARYLWEICEVELGDSEHFRAYTNFSGKIKGRGPFYAILSEDSQGFIDITWYKTEAELIRAWEYVEREYDTFCRESEDGGSEED